MKKILEKYKELYIIFAFVLIFAGTYYFVMKFLLVRIDDQKIRIQQAIALGDFQLEKLNKVNVMSDQYDFIVSEEVNIPEILRRDDAVSFIQKIENIASDTDNFVEISVSEVEDRAKPSKKSNKKNEVSVATMNESLSFEKYLNVGISVLGSYDSVRNLMYKLENFEYYSDILAFQIIKNDKSDGSGNSGGSSNPFILNDNLSRSPSSKNKDEDAVMPKNYPIKAIVQMVVYIQE